MLIFAPTLLWFATFVISLLVVSPGPQAVYPATTLEPTPFTIFDSVAKTLPGGLSKATQVPLATVLEVAASKPSTQVVVLLVLACAIMALGVILDIMGGVRAGSRWKLSWNLWLSSSPKAPWIELGMKLAWEHDDERKQFYTTPDAEPVKVAVKEDDAHPLVDLETTRSVGLLPISLPTVIHDYSTETEQSQGRFSSSSSRFHIHPPLRCRQQYGG